MQPLSEEQEATMLRWAVTVGNRPGKRAKLFLQADRGFTEEQIDHWWDNAMASQEARKLHVRSIAPAVHMHPRSFIDSHNLPYERPVSTASNSSAVDLMRVKQLTSSPQRPHAGPNGEDILFPIPTIPSQPATHADAYSHHRASLSTLSSTAPSFVTTTSSKSSKSTASSQSNLSVPSQKWEMVNHSSRSSVMSYGSSQPPVKDSASSMFSFVEVLPEDYMDVELTAQSDAFINPAELSNPLNYPFFGNTQAGSLWGDRGPFTISLPVISGTGEPHHDHTKNYHQDAMSYTSFSVDPPEAEIIPKVEKVLARFACTMCQRAFTNKGDWKRHEGSQCEPQKSWICMLGNNPAVMTDAGLACTFCDVVIKAGPDPSEMLAHLEKEHKINQCIRKPPGDRSFRRKDKLKTHLQRLHNLCDNSNHWEKWQQSATQDKFAWGCGFCGVCLFTWEGRLEHISEHFEKHLDISEWSQSLMIQGLLKQPTPEFNVLEAWRSLVDADSDRQMEWSKDDAAELKLKLEFRKGTPTELARLAYRLAKLTTSHAGDRMSIAKEISWQQAGLVS